MKLKKAIEQAQSLAMQMELFEQTSDTAAIKLLIEAGKRLKLLRLLLISQAEELLPGETKD